MDSKRASLLIVDDPVDDDISFPFTEEVFIRLSESAASCVGSLSSDSTISAETLSSDRTISVKTMCDQAITGVDGYARRDGFFYAPRPIRSGPYPSVTDISSPAVQIPDSVKVKEKDIQNIKFDRNGWARKAYEDALAIVKAGKKADPVRKTVLAKPGAPMGQPLPTLIPDGYSIATPEKPVKKVKPPVEVTINGHVIEPDPEPVNAERSSEDKDREAYLQARREIKKLRAKHKDLGPATISVEPGSGKAVVTIDTWSAMEGIDL